MGQAKRRIGHQGVPGAYSDLAATSFLQAWIMKKRLFLTLKMLLSPSWTGPSTMGSFPSKILPQAALPMSMT